jgi:hypothetical protein
VICLLITATEGVPDVQVSDREYATLRKFVFVMRFRSTLFFEGFNHRQPADYTGSDKDMLLAYMHEKGILRPVDVWLEALVAILDPEADAEDTWARTLGPGHLEAAFTDHMRCQQNY